ncbi:MAG: hypothetical protein K2Q12_08375 [Rickettsiales bacterium]|nr:hypothetical protein [Rickettsiales bacterium]
MAGAHMLCTLLACCIALTACTPQEREAIPQPQSKSQGLVDLRNDGYFERLNINEKDKD